MYHQRVFVVVVHMSTRSHRSVHASLSGSWASDAITIANAYVRRSLGAFPLVDTELMHAPADAAIMQHLVNVNLSPFPRSATTHHNERPRWAFEATKTNDIPSMFGRCSMGANRGHGYASGWPCSIRLSPIVPQVVQHVQRGCFFHADEIRVTVSGHGSPSARPTSRFWDVFA